MSPYLGMYGNPVLYNDPDGDCSACLVIVGAAVVNGLINVGSQALKGNIHNLGQGLEYFAVGAVAGAAYVMPGGGALLGGSIQAGGNKAVQYFNGQWSPDDIHNIGDVANLALDVGTDYLSPGLGANLGKALIQDAGWFTRFWSGSGRWVITAEQEGAFSVARTSPVEVISSRLGLRAVQGAELAAADVIEGTGTKLLNTTRENLLNVVENPKLKNIVNDLYRPGARIGGGSSMDAYRVEQIFQNLMGKTHGIKLINYRTALLKLWKNRSSLAPGEKEIIKRLLTDIQNALSGN